MHYYQKRRRKRCYRIICYVTLLCSIVYLSISVMVSGQKMNQCKSSKLRQGTTDKYIFNLARWRDFHVNYLPNGTLWCDVPNELKVISDAICKVYNMGSCKRLPCFMIYTSPQELEDIKCMNGGRMLKNHNDVALERQSILQCKRGFALDLFLKKRDSFSYPSIIADIFTPISKELYIDVLNNRYRSCDSMWGFNFNFESISYYPWAGDSQTLRLFDITFGYDRSLFDLIPAPWLFNYVEKLKFNSKRLSIEEVMSSKKPIYSMTSSDLYWINTQQVSKSEVSIGL